MSISLDQLTQILAEAGISSSQEEEILIAAKRFTTPPEVEEESTFEELSTSDEEQLCEQKIEEDEEGISSDQNEEVDHAYESRIEHWFQVSTKVNEFCFCFYFIESHLQELEFISCIFVNVRFHFSKSNVNLCLLLLSRWLHWKFHFI